MLIFLKQKGASLEDYEQIVKFLTALDEQITEKVELYIVGGSSITLTIDRQNRTEDIDVVEVEQKILDIAGKKSELANKYNVYIQKVSEVGFSAPNDWRDKAKQIGDLDLRKISLYSADIHDVVLGKLARLEHKDIEDITGLHENNYLNINYLLKRLNQNKKELLKQEYKNNAKLAFKLIFNKKLIFRQGKAKIN